MSNPSGNKAKIPVNQNTSYTNDAAFAQTLRTALVANGSIPTIQETLGNELQRTGWSANLRAYVTQLMRSGECTNYDELMAKVLQQAQVGAEDNDAGLKIPDSVNDKGLKVVMKEIKKVADVDDDDGDE